MSVAPPLNLTMNVGGGLRLRIVERPGACLRADRLAALVADMRAVARAVLPGGDLNYGVLGGDPERLARAVITVVHDRRTGEPVAFNALTLMDVVLAGRPMEVLHLGLVMVDPKLRSRGLSDLLYGLTCVLLFMRRNGRPLHLSNVTQVPAVFGMVAETFDGVFPTPERRRSPGFVHRILARQIMQRQRDVFGVGEEATFDEERSLILNAYTGGSDDLKKTFPSAPKHRKEAYNNFCLETLDYARGDDVLQIGQINMAAAARYLSKIAKPQSAPWVAGQLVIFALQSAILPVLQWFDVREAWGSLRPRQAVTERSV